MVQFFNSLLGILTFGSMPLSSEDMCIYNLKKYMKEFYVYVCMSELVFVPFIYLNT